MNTLDIILIVTIAIGFAIGYYKGLILQLTTGAGIVIGLLQAILFWPLLSMFIIELTGWSTWITTPLSFILIVVAVVLIFKLIGAFLKGICKIICLQFVDRLFGAIFSTIITVMIIVGITTVISRMDEENSVFGKISQNKSLLYKPVQKLTYSFLDELKKEVNEKKIE